MINDGTFRFDDETHSYFLGDRRLIGVTEAIKEAGLQDFSKIDPSVLARAAERGKAVHLACHYLDDDDLEWGTVSAEIAPYVRAWERFKDDTGVILNAVESPRWNATYGFAGTPDREVILNGKKGTIDLKTYKPDDVTGVQLAAYSFLAYGTQPSYDAPKRWGLWLKDDGKYALTEFEDRGDLDMFMACLKLTKWKRRQK